ncbi:MAG: hypothetical protein ACJAS4_001309 [Bacteriovoracaceae bacterium]|jgi:hypothetical protein
MNKKMISITNSIIILISAIMYIPQDAYSQDENLDGLVGDTKNDLMVVVGGGLAGAVLGLSTLSFVEEPKEHTRNIIVGASIGIIAGVGFVAFSQANKTQDLIYGSDGGDMDEASYKDPKEFNTYARNDWHYQNVGETYTPIISPYNIGYNLKF